MVVVPAEMVQDRARRRRGGALPPATLRARQRAAPRTSSIVGGARPLGG